MTTFTADEKATCAEREARYRQRVYTRLVSLGRMKLDDASYQIAVMSEIAADYRVQADLDAPQLFGQKNADRN